MLVPISETELPAVRLKRLETIAAETARSASFRLFVDRMVERERRRDPSQTALQAWLHFVQSLPYRSGPKGEWIETDARETARNGGECKALSVLFVAGASALGFQTRLAWLSWRYSQQAHVTAMVQVPGSGWEWTDATVAGARVGEAPESAAERVGSPYGVRGVVVNSQ